MVNGDQAFTNIQVSLNQLASTKDNIHILIETKIKKHKASSTPGTNMLARHEE